MLDARRSRLQLPLMREVTALQRNLRTLQDPGTSSSVTTSGGSSAGGVHHKKKKGKTQTFIGDPHQDAQALARELSGKLAKSTNPVHHHGNAAARESTMHTLRIEKLQAKRRTIMKSKSFTSEDAASQPEIELGVKERIQRIEKSLQDPERRSSLSQLLQDGNHDAILEHTSRSAPDLLHMVQGEEQRGSMFESSDEEQVEIESLMSRETMVRKNAPIPSAMRGKEDLKKPIRKKKPKSSRLRERTVKVARIRKEPIILDDDELGVSEIPNGCGVPWDWSSVHKHRGRAFLDLTGLTCALPESSKEMRPELEPELHPPVQSISSLDSDANALPFIIGEDGHDSDLAGYYIRSQETRAGKRKASLQDAVKDVPGNVSPLPLGPHPHRTLTQKYRPKNFKEIVGQPVVVKSLSTAILKCKVAPVYLFIGPRGTGKTSAARVFAAGLNCLSPDVATRPCGICRECGTLALNRSADVRQIDAAANADLPSLRAMMGSFTPHARYKIFIVENCDLLSNEIWNSFLKLLEEPPLNVVFILVTTEADGIPATAKSRCQKFPFSKLKGAEIVKRLEHVASREGLVVEVGAFELIAVKADGSLRDAEIILDQLCLVHKSISVASVQELVGLLPDHKVFDLLDHALSANTVHIVRTMREVLAMGVEPLALVSQLGALITDILVGSVDVSQDHHNPSGFFSRKFSEKEEVNRLRQALKILSEAEKQLRVANDGATWLTAALLQFAPDRSFLPSESSMSSALASPDVVEPQLAPNYGDDEVEDDMQGALQLVVVHEENFAGDAMVEVEHHGATSSEQKLEEAWAGEPPLPSQDGLPAPTSAAYQVFQGEVLAELWKRVVWEVTPRNLKNMLVTQGRLVGAGVAVDGSCAVVELAFDHARDKHKAERSWRAICVAFQAVLTTAVELRIALTDAFPEESEVVRPPLSLTAAAASAAVKPPPSPANSHPPPPPPTPPRLHPRPRTRGSRARRHRHATELLERELGAQFSSDASRITPRRPPPPSRRRRVKKLRAAGAPRPALEVPEIELVDPASMVDFAGSRSLTREIWEALTMDSKPDEKKKRFSEMLEEPLSDIDDLFAAQTRILRQQQHHVQFQNDPSLIALAEHRSGLVADLQRGLPVESSVVCWRRGSPQSEFLMRRARVKSLNKTEGKGLFLKLVPCSTTSVTPASSAARVQ